MGSLNGRRVRIIRFYVGLRKPGLAKTALAKTALAKTDLAKTDLAKTDLAKTELVVRHASNTHSGHLARIKPEFNQDRTLAGLKGSNCGFQFLICAHRDPLSAQ